MRGAQIAFSQRDILHCILTENRPTEVAKQIGRIIEIDPTADLERRAQEGLYRRGNIVGTRPEQSHLGKQ